MTPGGASRGSTSRAQNMISSPVVDYREPLLPPADAEPAALMELGLRLRTLRRWVLLPGIILTLAAGVAGAMAHVGGYWSIFPTFSDDGSYFVHKGSVAIALLIPGSVVFGAVWLAYTGLRTQVRRAWRKDAARRFRLDDEALADIELTLE